MLRNEMKYIMVGHNRPILFLDTWNHDDMARALGVIDKVTSAGFVMFSLNKIYCHKKSTTLDLKPAKNDADVIANALGIFKERN